MMRNATLAAAMMMIMVASTAAQDHAADEQAIRDIVARMNAGQPPVDLKTFRPKGDEIFWSGALVRPQVGTEKPQFRPGSSGGGGRSNASQQVQIVQLHVSASGDMAYEFSTFRSSWVRNDSRKKIETEGALLRTWRKIDGQWLIAAHFQHPYDSTPTER